MSEKNVGDSKGVEAGDEKWKANLRKSLSSMVPYDPRFPNMNQTRNCQTNYLDYYRCLKKKDGDEEYCAWYKNAYERLCPDEWVEKWNEQRENGLFPFKDC